MLNPVVGYFHKMTPFTYISVWPTWSFQLKNCSRRQIPSPQLWERNASYHVIWAELLRPLSISLTMPLLRLIITDNCPKCQHCYPSKLLQMLRALEMRLSTKLTQWFHLVAKAKGWKRCYEKLNEKQNLLFQNFMRLRAHFVCCLHPLPWQVKGWIA